jgi:hypothetical protein
MRFPLFKSTIAASIMIMIVSCSSPASKNESQTQAMDSVKTTPQIKTEEVNYTFNGKQSNGFIAYDENLKGKLPIVVIVHEWWGLKII